MDLLAAVTADLPAAVPSPGSAGAVTTVKPSTVAALPAPAATPAPDRTAGAVALAGVAAAAVVWLVAITMRRGRRRGWKPGRRSGVTAG